MEMRRQLKETIIYGGAFNPPTRAHQAILQACINRAMYTDADIWLMPSGERADKHIGVSRERRIELIEAMCADVVRRGVTIDIARDELDREAPTETYDTAMRLEHQYEDRHFWWVFGSDSVATMPTWHKGEWLADNLDLLVVERPGFPMRKLGGHAIRLPVDMIATSSTEVRERLARNEPIDHLVSASVLHSLEAV